ncbi:heavy metal-binding domain-containing protein [Sandarakinorhabdus sp. AAP62]|uniref:heavy metal-binding domain-containing protein n=1 Tax=Sandarakinorhabdus sp. AAP62 TaxID=1248916 RepID=UPI0002FDCB2E|nr:heavy metal-binding domain-containing protein [Sandarakinorhabdus sp. AAP62]
MQKIWSLVLGTSVLLLASSVVAKDAPKAFVVVNESVGVPVFPGDISDRPYDVVGEVQAGVRKATIFSKEASQSKIYKELWERAEKLGADAVINAKYGDSHVTAMSWGKTNATGTAIKFKPAAPAATPTP